MSLHVDSEVGRLQQVIVHRPGLELTRLTPGNVDELLFDDVMWAQRAREEHDAFAQQARATRGRCTTSPSCSPRPWTSRCPGVRPGAADHRDPVRTRAGRAAATSWSGSTPAGPLAELLIGGVLKRDVQLAATRRACSWSTWTGRLPPRAAAEPPVPAGQLGLGLRRHVHQPDGQAGPEARDHQLPARLQLPPDVPRRRRLHFYYGNDDVAHDPANIEGGDILVIGNGAVMIGMGERTTPQGVEILAAGAVPRRIGQQGDRRRAAQDPRVHAPRHRDDDDRPGRVQRVPLPARRAAVLHADAPVAAAVTTQVERERRALPGRRRGARHRQAARAADTHRQAGRPARAVGRRQQLPGRGPGRDLRLRAEHDDQHVPAPTTASRSSPSPVASSDAAAADRAA